MHKFEYVTRTKFDLFDSSSIRTKKKSKPNYLVCLFQLENYKKSFELKVIVEFFLEKHTFRSKCTIATESQTCLRIYLHYIYPEFDEGVVLQKPEEGYLSHVISLKTKAQTCCKLSLCAFTRLKLWKVLLRYNNVLSFFKPG